MSYDLFVFSLEYAPKERESFLDWYDAQTEWENGRTCDDPERTAPKLRAWFFEMIQSFPPMNGPLRRNDLPEDDRSSSDYGINDHGIYVGFSWSMATKAYEAMRHLAEKHGVGFFDVSSDDSEVWAPDGSGVFTVIHRSDA
jgi:hypothetical protein